MEPIKNSPPETILEAARYFSHPETCVRFLGALRWPKGPECPRCRSREASFLKTRLLWKCKGCKKQFSVKVGSVFEDSAVSLDKWLTAAWMIANCRNGISSYEIARDLGVTQKTAWFMLHRIRLVMQTRSFSKLRGTIEVDESFIGGKARNMHKKVRERKIKGRGPEGKAIVAAVLERHGEVRAASLPTRRKKDLHKLIRENVEPGSEVYTDDLKSYDDLDEYTHEAINHAKAYVDGQVHTNGLENFWSLLKRGIKGTDISVEPFHLFRYLDEQVYRYNLRTKTDRGRFETLLARFAGRRLTYTELTAPV